MCGEFGINNYVSKAALTSYFHPLIYCAVVRAGKDFTYLLVVLGGFAVAGFLLWSVGSEFFSFNSPQTVYTKALKRVKQDIRVRLYRLM